jgi:membrane protease YdiL (CAAX protease family)
VSTALPAPAASWRIVLGVVALAVGILLAGLVGGSVVQAVGWDFDVAAGDGADFGRVVGQTGTDQTPDHNRVPLVISVLLNVPLWAGFIGLPLWARRARGLDWCRDMGWSMTRLDVPVGLAIGVLTQAVLVPLLYIPILRSVDSAELEEPARNLVASANSPLGVAALILLTIVAAPVAEEILFRGLLFRGIYDMEAPRSFAMPLAVVVSSAIFAASHFQYLQFPGLFLIGAVAAYAMHRTGRLGTAIWIHVGFNATTVLILLPEFY